MRTITAPGVEIKEIDKSQYSPSMTGTACYVMGFSNKGEAYIPMEFTSRAAWTSYYGEPTTEAEKYFYNACVEVLNQNGRLYCARLPYDNNSFEKMTKFTYNTNLVKQLGNVYNDYDFSDVTAVDNTISTVVVIQPSNTPDLIDLAEVDEFRTDEKKVANDTFIIVDKTCGAYNKIEELADKDGNARKGKAREILGIVPVVTTAVNAMYAQKLIQVENKNAKWYESIGYCNTLRGETAGIFAGDAQNINSEYNIFNKDLVRQLNSVYKNYSLQWTNYVDYHCKIVNDIYEKINELAKSVGREDDVSTTVGDWPATINEEIDILIEVWSKDELKKTKIADLIAIKIDTTKTITIGMLQYSIEELAKYWTAELKNMPADGDDTLPNTVSFEANEFFSTIQYNPDLSSFDRTNLKKIGLVVYKAFIDSAEGNKIAFQPVEAYVGSLYKDDKDINTGMSTFLDTIVNTNSDYIYFFSNCFNTAAMRQKYLGIAATENIDTFVMQATSTTGILGFYEEDVKKNISVSKSIYDGMNKCFDKVSDINERDIDIVPDAGLANIASFIKALKLESAEYDLNMKIGEDEDSPTAISMWTAKENNEAVKTWKSVEQKFDNFCKNIRKDCMFIADGLRPMVIQGQKKIVRPSKPTNNIDKDILPYVKFMSGLNTNYGAGYMDWFEIADEFTGDFFWCPPSIKAMGVYIYTDSNFQYWDAPAGLNRGMIAATDVAFSPTAKQAGAIYEKNWNYAINYPTDGIVLEGQKTFQVKPSAFDRVNVRRLFLRLERAAYKVARYFVYEGNTAYTRQRLVDALDPYFKAAKIGGGVYDYKIICDESINTPTVIDNNELKVKIGIKPTKTAEYILIDFIAVSTGGSFEEAMA